MDSLRSTMGVNPNSLHLHEQLTPFGLSRNTRIAVGVTVALSRCPIFAM